MNKLKNKTQNNSDLLYYFYVTQFENKLTDRKMNFH